MEAAAQATGPERHAYTQTVVHIVTDHGFQDTHLLEIKDVRRLQVDLQRALETAAADDSPELLPLLAESALALVRFRRERLRPEPIFEFARQGDISAARRLLDMFETDRKWQQTALLEIAWLAGSSPALDVQGQARALRLDVAAELKEESDYDQRQMLLKWIESDLSGSPTPQRTLPEAPTAPELRALMYTAAGTAPEADISPELLYGATGGNLNMLAAMRRAVDNEDLHELSEDMFFSHYIGPKLIAYACNEPSGEEYLREYLGVHSAYNYANYRFGSLWALLRSILQHPSAAWVRDNVASLLCSAMGGGSTEFEKGLPLTVLALRASSGDGDAAKSLSERATVCRRLAAEMRQYRSGGTAESRTHGDTWGHCKRLLATLAEAQTMIGLDVSAPARDLVDEAMHVRYGFAGYQAPTCLTLAETIRIARIPEEAQWGEACLEGAQQAAHNIQEGTFCARMTARVNAMRSHRWPASRLELSSETAAVVGASSAEAFSSLHFIGHAYTGRGGPPNSFPLPSRVRNANTITMLADAYQRGLPEFLRLNRDWEPDQQIPEGRAVRVPDPGLAPLVAARLSAEALVTLELTQAERVALIRSLVPVAAANPTALDTVLSRLLLAERPTSSAILDRLAELAPMPEDTQQNNLRSELTIVPP
jgi:hypothetical protein